MTNLVLYANDEDAQAFALFFELASAEVEHARVAERERNKAYDDRARMTEQRDDLRECLLVLANETNIRATMNMDQAAMVADALRLSE